MSGGSRPSTPEEARQTEKEQDAKRIEQALEHLHSARVSLAAVTMQKPQRYKVDLACYHAESAILWAEKLLPPKEEQ